jgi:YHS domain-containing protein
VATAIDPVCKMKVDTGNPPGGQSDYRSSTYYFCAPGCKVAFDNDPEKYLAPNWQGIPMEISTKETPTNQATSKPRSLLSRLLGKGG